MSSSDRVAEDGTLSQPQGRPEGQPQGISNPGEVAPEKPSPQDLNRALLDCQAQLNTLRLVADSLVQAAKRHAIPDAVRAHVLTLNALLQGRPPMDRLALAERVISTDPACRALGFVRTGAAQDALAIVADMTDQGAEQAAHDVDKLLAMLNGRRSVTYFSDIVSRRNSTESQTTNLNTGE